MSTDYSYQFAKPALKDIQKLPLHIKERIIGKLNFFVESGIPLYFADNLIDSEIGSYRFRVGDYRIIFDIEDTVLVILRIKHRREVYK